MTLERLKNILDDAQHPDTTPAWVAILVVVLMILFIIWRVRSVARRHRASQYDAARAHHQKLHEGERW